MILTIAGCAVGPNYKRPEISAPGEVRGELRHRISYEAAGRVLDALIYTRVMERIFLSSSTAFVASWRASLSSTEVASSSFCPCEPLICS